MLKINKIIFKAIVTFLIVVAMSAVMSGCGEIYTQVENLMKVTDDFVGERVITLRLDSDFAGNKDKKHSLKQLLRKAVRKI